MTNKQHHHHQHKHTDEIDVNPDEDLKENSNVEESKEDGKKEKENSKMFEVEESLGEADEKNNIARHRSFRPKGQGEIFKTFPFSSLSIFKIF